MRNISKKEWPLRRFLGRVCTFAAVAVITMLTAGRASASPITFDANLLYADGSTVTGTVVIDTGPAATVVSADLILDIANSPDSYSLTSVSGLTTGVGIVFFNVNATASLFFPLASFTISRPSNSLEGYTGGPVGFSVYLLTSPAGGMIPDGATGSGSLTLHSTEPPTVPEPTTMLLLGTGLVGVVARRRRR